MKNQIMKNSVLFSLLVFLFSVAFIACDDNQDSTPTPVNPPINSAEDLSKNLQKVIDETEMPGFTVAIVKNGEVTYQNSFGFADITSQKPYTNQTTQPIGSISKTFIGAAIVKAIEEGYFTLETDINDILPVELINPKNPSATIKVKHLVTHTSGLVDNAYLLAYHILPGENMNTSGAQKLTDLMGVQQRDRIPLEEYLAEYYLEDGDLFSEDNFSANVPGTVWEYSNVAASLAAYLVESATGKSFDEYVFEKIFQPLGMNNSAFFPSDLNAEKMATLYFNKNTPLPLYGNDSYPDGSVNTSNEDLTKYLLDMIKGASGNSELLFSKDGYKMLFNPLLPAGTVPSTLGDNQGIFWILGNGDIKHDGGDPGLTTFMQFFPEEKTGFLLLTNMDASVDENEENFSAAVASIFGGIQEFLSAN
ncbi:MAG: serine hydrolase domain-containing protein [Saprospiraceae bacterium]